jgi:prefoldin subunit 5
MKKKELLRRIETLECQVDECQAMITLLYQRYQHLEDAITQKEKAVRPRITTKICPNRLV